MSAPNDTSPFVVASPGQSDKPCGGLSSLLPLGMSCRGRAEAFARRLQSRLRTLGSQETVGQNITEDGGGSDVQTENSWLGQTDPQVTSLQPARNNLPHEADSFFDFDLEPESPGSPVDECEYSRLIETATTTPQPSDVLAPESGYVCASPISAEGSLASQSSSDGPYFDPESSEADQKSTDYYDCIGSRAGIPNGRLLPIVDVGDGDSGSDSLPPSQATTITTTTTSSTTTPNSSDVTPSAVAAAATTATAATKSESNSTITGLSFNYTTHDETETDLENRQQRATEPVDGAADTRECKESEKSGCGEIENILLSNTHYESTDKDKGFNRLHIDHENAANEEAKPIDDVVVVTAEEIQPTASEDQVDFIANGKDQEEEEEDAAAYEKALQANNEQIILDCLNVIDATPEASPEPESNRENNDPEGHLKVDDGEPDVEDRPQRVRRCSSLKTGKTPPGTPGRKKFVRFADVLGLDLAAVRTFMDEMPKIPKSAFEDLDLAIEAPVSLGPRVDKVLMPLFQQPGSLAGYLDMVRDKQVCLENAAVTDPVTMVITGCVRVRNLDFHKSVYVRYSTDSWRSYSDLQGNYVENSCDGFSDKFTFVLYGNALGVGDRIELAVRFHCKGQIFWDNNYGTNYCFQCLPVSTPNRSAVTVPDHVATSDSWTGASFY